MKRFGNYKPSIYNYFAQTIPQATSWFQLEETPCIDSWFEANQYNIFDCRCADDKPFTPVYQVSVEKAKNLGIQFIPLVESLKETVESLKEKNFINF